MKLIISFSLFMLASLYTTAQDYSDLIVGEWLAVSESYTDCEDKTKEVANSYDEKGCVTRYGMTTCGKTIIDKKGGYIIEAHFGANKDSYNCTYKLKGNELIVHQLGTDFAYTIEIKDNIMTLVSKEKLSGCTYTTVGKKM